MTRWTVLLIVVGAFCEVALPAPWSGGVLGFCVAIAYWLGRRDATRETLATIAEWREWAR